MRALTEVTGPSGTALAVAARAAEGEGAALIDNRALLWLLRSEVGLKFPARWFLP